MLRTSPARFPLAPVALAAAVALSALSAPVALAQTPAAAVELMHNIQLPAQPLGNALNELARQAKLQLLVQRELVEGKQAPAVSGQMTARQALQRLLAGSGLSAVTEGAAFVLKPLSSSAQMPASEPALTLQTVEVIGRVEKEAFSEFTFSATKTQTHILDVPQTVSTVTKELIQEQGMRQLNEIGSLVAGVNQFSVYNDLTIRGFRNQDERRVNGHRTYNGFWTQSPIAHLEKVEIIKGPAAAAFGDASPGGVVNFVTKKPLAEQRREIGLGYGTYDNKFASADFTGPLLGDKKILYRFNLVAEDTDTFRDAIKRQQLTLAPSLSWIPDGNTRVNLDWVYTDSKGVVDRGQPNVRNSRRIDQVPINVSVTQVGDKADVTQNSLIASVDHKLSTNWRLAASVSHSNFDEDMVEHRNDSWIDDDTFFLRYGERTTKADVNSISTYLTGQFKIGALQHKLMLGLDHHDMDERSSEMTARRVAQFDVLNPLNIARNVSSYALSPYSWSSRIKNTALYVQDQIGVGQWDFTVGLRRDAYRTTGVDAGVQAVPQKGSQISPRLSVGYKVSDSESVYGSWITGFEPPEGWMSAPIYGGPFKPQDSELFEVGYKRMFNDGRLLFTAAVYQITKNNAIIPANDEDNPDLYVQGGSERSRGVEFELAGRVTPRLSVVGNYAYNMAKYIKNTDPAIQGKRLENAPEHSAALWGRYDLGSGWGVGLGAQYVDERETFTDLVLPSYTVLNAGLFYSVGRSDWSLTVKNLTNKTHWTGGYNYERVFPGTPRTISLHVKYRF